MAKLQLQGLSSNRNQLAHGYIVSAIDYVWAQQQSELLAKAILCKHNIDNISQACNECQSCTLYEAGNHPDLKIVDGGSDTVGIDEIRELSSFLHKTPQISGSQMVLIKSADNMTENAANALLKTLEEPTPHSYVLLQSAKLHSLLATIRSRCQILTLEKPQRQQLKLDMPHIPDYIWGFYQNAQQVVAQLSNEQLAEFEQVFSYFKGWLQRKNTATELLQLTEKLDNGSAFLIYLLQRRLTQLLIQQNDTNKHNVAQDAVDLINQHLQLSTLRNNDKTAITALLVQLESVLFNY